MTDDEHHTELPELQLAPSVLDRPRATAADPRRGGRASTGRGAHRDRASPGLNMRPVDDGLTLEVFVVDWAGDDAVYVVVSFETERLARFSPPIDLN